MKTLGLVIHEPVEGADPMDPLTIPELDELAEKGKSIHDKALEKYDF